MAIHRHKKIARRATVAPLIRASKTTEITLTLSKTDPSLTSQIRPALSEYTRQISSSWRNFSRRPYSRLTLLALFPSLAAVDSTDITPEEKRMSKTIASGNIDTTSANTNHNSSASSNGNWGNAAAGVGSGSGGGGGSGSSGGGGGWSVAVGGSGISGGGSSAARGVGAASTMGGNYRRDHFKAGIIGTVGRKGPGGTTGGGVGG